MADDDLLESIKASLLKDQHLMDQVLKIIRESRSKSGQTLDDYMKQKEFEEKDLIEQRRRQSNKI